jgi:hypothetical protein
MQIFATAHLLPRRFRGGTLRRSVLRHDGVIVRLMRHIGGCSSELLSALALSTL